MTKAERDELQALRTEVAALRMEVVMLRGRAGGSAMLQGTITHVHTWRSALSPEQILAHYNDSVSRCNID